MSLAPTKVELEREMQRKLYETKTPRWDWSGHETKGIHVVLFYESCRGYGTILITCSLLVYKIEVLIVFTIKNVYGHFSVILSVRLLRVGEFLF